MIERLGVESGEGRLGKGYQILGTDEKSESNNKNAFHPALKFDTLSCGFVFLRMPEVSWQLQCFVDRGFCCGNGKHLQKTMH